MKRFVGTLLQVTRRWVKAALILVAVVIAAVTLINPSGPEAQTATISSWLQTILERMNAHHDLLCRS
jgi:hypothetical protein